MGYIVQLSRHFADSVANVIRQVFYNGTIITILGNGTAGLGSDTGLGTSIMLNAPRAVASDGAGGIVVGDTSNACVRSWFANNASVSTLAGKVREKEPWLTVLCPRNVL